MGGREGGEGEGASADSSTNPPPQKTEWRRRMGGSEEGKENILFLALSFGMLPAPPAFAPEEIVRWAHCSFFPSPIFFLVCGFQLLFFRVGCRRPKSRKFLARKKSIFHASLKGELASYPARAGRSELPFCREPFPGSQKGLQNVSLKGSFGFVSPPPRLALTEWKGKGEACLRTQTLQTPSPPLSSIPPSPPFM